MSTWLFLLQPIWTHCMLGCDGTGTIRCRWPACPRCWEASHCPTCLGRDPAACFSWSLQTSKTFQYFNITKYLNYLKNLFLSFTNEVSVVKGINFHIEKNLARAYRDAKCVSVCVSVCLSVGKNGITFDPLLEIN